MSEEFYHVREFPDNLLNVIPLLQDAVRDGLLTVTVHWNLLLPLRFLAVLQ